MWPFSRSKPNPPTKIAQPLAAQSIASVDESISEAKIKGNGKQLVELVANRDALIAKHRPRKPFVKIDRAKPVGDEATRSRFANFGGARGAARKNERPLEEVKPRRVFDAADLAQRTPMGAELRNRPRQTIPRVRPLHLRRLEIADAEALLPLRQPVQDKVGERAQIIKRVLSAQPAVKDQIAELDAIKERILAEQDIDADLKQIADERKALDTEYVANGAAIVEASNAKDKEQYAKRLEVRTVLVKARADLEARALIVLKRRGARDER